MNTKEIMILCPTRSRPHLFKRLADSWKNTTNGVSDLCAIIDNNDPCEYEKLNDVTYLYIDPPIKVRNHYNIAFEKFYNQYNYFVYLGDDNLFLINNWENIFIEKLKTTQNWGIVFCNDGYHGAELATSSMISTKLAKAIGYIAHPDLNYDYVDDVMQTIAAELNIKHYLPEIYIEHIHPIYNTKGVWDDIYIKGDPFRSLDAQIFANWKHDQMPTEIKRIKNIIENDLRSQEIV